MTSNIAVILAVVTRISRQWVSPQSPGFRRSLKGRSMEKITSQSSSGDINTELSSRRTGMSFQRTRMSADRTLMSVVRTSLSLISFGFTINQLFQKLKAQDVLGGGGGRPVRNFGATLVALGIGMLILGIVYHVQFMIGLRQERKAMKAAGLVHAESTFPVSLTLITAALLLVIGIMAILSMIFHFGPFD